MRVQRFKFLELIKIACKRLAPAISHAVHALIGRERPLVIGPGITLPRLINLKALQIRANVSKSVDQRRQLASRATRNQIVNKKVRSVNAPLGVVGYNLFVLML